MIGRKAMHGHELARSRVDQLDRVWTALGHSLHLLVFILLVVTVAADGMSWQVGAFAIAYASGRILPQRSLWMALVLVCWVLMFIHAESAVYIVFPLFFVALGAFRARVSVPLVILMTALAIYGIARHLGWSPGGVIGPIIGALVAIALGLGFRMLRVEAKAREKESHRAGEMQERTRIAGDIHDTVAQGLSSINMLLHSIEGQISSLDASPLDPETKNQLVRQIHLAQTTAQDNLLETRRIIAALQPSPMMGADLPVALARVTSSSPLGQAVVFDVDGEPRNVDAAVEQELVRIAQSLVSNVARHAQATRARVTLTYQPEEIVLDVVDNGEGFDPATLQEMGLGTRRTAEGTMVVQTTTAGTELAATGLPGVLRRVKSIRGAMALETAPGAGCGVAVRVPTGNLERHG
ncbi:histidine kinase [Corynebacterium resistens]|uniref:ATP-binding protein n=1 Tax=Corynebacterium resistens TaxID=258224 RepID=UPI002355733E|nr:sensor histidine kinase [Corynebacterium resistens]